MTGQVEGSTSFIHDPFFSLFIKSILMSTDTAPSEEHSEIEVNDGADLHLDLAQIESGLNDLKDVSMDSNELARQLEDLTGVVLNSAEASTRSASVAADVSGDLQKVMASINAAHQRSVSHSRIMLGAMLIFILISVGTFFAISTRMRQNIIQLDALSMAVGKRVVDLDATLGTFTESTQSFNELTEKLEKLSEAQSGIEKKFDEVTKAVTTVPGQIAEQSGKGLDGKFASIEKQMQALDAKIVALSNKPQPAPPAPGLSQQALSAELQKLKKELEQTALKAPREAPAVVPKPKEDIKPMPKLDSKVDSKADNKSSTEAKAEKKSEPKVEAKTAPVPVAASVAAPAPAPAAQAAPAPMPQFQPAREKMLVYPRPNNE